MDDPEAIAYAAQVLDPTTPSDRELLDRLRADSAIEVLDRGDEQLAGLRALRPGACAEMLDEGIRWAYYPWRRAVVAVLGPLGFRALRLDRNRNNITNREQDTLGSLTIGVAGLSVGHVIAHTLAAQGLFGRIRLADFDHLELSNLNRVPATVFDLGVNKAYVAARRIAELDPYLAVDVFDAGLTVDSMDAFFDGLDVFVEECDSFDIKAIARLRARERRIPVVMATSERGMVDVERFDDEPGRPILHGLMSESDVALLSSLSSRDKIPHLLSHLQAGLLPPRALASLTEIGRTLSTWPQVASDVVVGASAVAEAVRRIGLGETLRSGRCRVDVGAALDRLDEPEISAVTALAAESVSPTASSTIDDAIVAAAMRAPSGGNNQPWHIEKSSSEISISLDTRYTSSMDVGSRGSAVALGASLFNARVAAAAHGVLGPIEITEDEGGIPLRACMVLQGGHDPALAALYEPMLARETNRHRGTRQPIDARTIALLSAAAEGEGARLHLLTNESDLSDAATIFARADRIRYLTPHLHREMFSELRLPGDQDPDTGLDIETLALDAGDAAMLGILGRADVMACLAEWGAGEALGDEIRDRVRASSALAVITVRGESLRDYARGGSATEAVWTLAQHNGLSVQPLSPVFVHARGAAELAQLAPQFADELVELSEDFMRLSATAPEESIALVLRFSTAPPASVASRRTATRVSLRP